MNSLGYHELFLNGEKVGDNVLTPAVSQYNKRSHVITYDITGIVKKAGMILYSGWAMAGTAKDSPELTGTDRW